MNFGTVFKQTLKSTFNQISTIILIVLYCVITSILLIMVPAIMLGRGTPADMFSSAYLGNMMYVIAIILSISIGVYAANANELSEMTFIISRPVSRRTFLLAKSLCVLGIALCLYIWTLIMFVVYDAIFLAHNYAPFNNDGFSWATAIVPILLIIVYSVYLPFVLRTFFNDKIITLFLIWTVLASYQVYMITAQILHAMNYMYACLLIPSIVYGVGSVAAVTLAFATIQRVAIKV